LSMTERDFGVAAWIILRVSAFVESPFQKIIFPRGEKEILYSPVFAGSQACNLSAMSRKASLWDEVS